MKYIKLFEELDLTDIIVNININQELLNKLIDELSFVIYKNKKKKINIRIKSIDGFYNKQEINYKHTNIIIKMNNNDTLTGYYNEKNNNIKIYINNKLIFDVDYKNFDNNYLINKIVEEYKKYLKMIGYKKIYND